MNANPSPIPAVILDWAGTTVDHGCCAPMVALQTVLTRHGFDFTAAEARQGMGLAKLDHLRRLLATRGSAARAEEIYPELETEIFAQLEPHSGLIPGTLELSDWLRRRGIKIGTSTGYTATMMRIVTELAAAQGYKPDAVLTPDEVPAGRPAPYMVFANALKLQAWPLSSCVKIGDTPSDIAEGRNAGCWTVGVALSGNALGLTAAELTALIEPARTARFEAARSELRTAGADYVVDSLADCPVLLEEIAGRIHAGELSGRGADLLRPRR